MIVKNQRNYNYVKRKRDIDEFNSKFSNLKSKMLGWARIPTSKFKGRHENVYEIYLPLEEWTKKAIFGWAPGFKQVYDNVVGEEKIAFLGYLKRLEREMFIDYYFARKNKDEKNERKFYAKYGFNILGLRDLIAKSYKNLSDELKKYNTTVLDNKGDYLFVKADDGIKKSKLVYVVRELPVYEIK